MAPARIVFIARVIAGIVSAALLAAILAEPQREVALFPHPLTQISAYVDQQFDVGQQVDVEPPPEAGRHLVEAHLARTHLPRTHLAGAESVEAQSRSGLASEVGEIEIPEASLAKGSSVTPLNSDQSSFICDIKDGQLRHSCGAALSFLRSAVTSGERADPLRNRRYLNFSDVSSIQVRFGYRGDAPKLRLYMRNAENQAPDIPLDIAPEPSMGDLEPRRIRDEKIVAAVLQRSEINKPLNLGLQEFSVPAAWIDQSQTPRFAAMPEFDSVYQLAIEVVGGAPVGSHVFAIESVKAIKPRLHEESVLIGIALGWLALLVVELWVVLQLSLAKRQHRPMTLATIAQRHAAPPTDEDHDNITGLLNREAMTRLAERLFATYPSLSLSVSLIDIDYLKHINRSHGDLAGDVILNQVGQRLQERLRRADLLGYWSRGAYLLICQHASAADAYNLAEKLRQAMLGHQFDCGDQCGITLTISAGVCMVADHEPFEYAVERAHQALQQAKDTGRNCVRMA